VNGICQSCAETSRRTLVVVTRDGLCGVCGSRSVQPLSTSAAGAAAIITAQKERSLKAAAMDLTCAGGESILPTAQHLDMVLSDYLKHMAEAAEVLSTAGSGQ
jgi:hypothetical protein